MPDSKVVYLEQLGEFLNKLRALFIANPANAQGFLQNDGTGDLSWLPISPTVIGFKIDGQGHLIASIPGEGNPADYLHIDDDPTSPTAGHLIYTY